MKVVFIGDAGVGKTALRVALSGGEFAPEYVPTLGVEINDAIWDTAGDARYAGLREGYYTGAELIVLTFDLSNWTSYAGLPAWYALARRTCPDAEILVCGAKCDLPAAVVPNFTRYEYIPVSARTGENVEELRARLAGPATCAKPAK